MSVELAAGQHVSARFGASEHGPAGTRWFHGIIEQVNEDGSRKVLYEDGDVEMAVHPKYIKATSGPTAHRRETLLNSRTLPSKNEDQLDQAGGEEQLGRGQRLIKPTVAMVGGYAIKRQNMYDMEEGEGSVWDRELGKEPKGFKARERMKYMSAKKEDVAKPKPRVHSAEEKIRQARNEQLKAAEGNAARARAAFLAPYAGILRRFGARELPPPADTVVAPFDENLQQPKEISRTVQMRDYQLHGLRWLSMMHANGMNAILADEMGLGKTLQTIAFLAHLKFELGVPGPHLVVAPLSVLSSWMTELKRFCPALRAVKLHSTDMEERMRLVQTLSNNPKDYDVVVTTFETAKAANMQRFLAQRTWWRYLIVDEGHALKNEGSLVSQALRSYHAAHKLLLTGTPLQNNLHELWSLLNFLYPDIFSSSTHFDNAFKLDGRRVTVESDTLEEASRMLQPLMLRRTKAEVEKGMLPKLETTIHCPLSEMQLFWYKRLLLRESSLLKQLEEENGDLSSSSGTDWRKLASLLMQLRKCCNHPFLFPNVEPSGEEDYIDQLVNGSGKFQLLRRLLAKLFAKGHRVVLFSQFTSTLDLIEDFLNHEQYKYCRLDGSTNRVQRTVDINSFNMPGSSKFVFLMSTRAGGLGINCQTADTCILFDSDWNPQVDLQAMARVHRIGQTKKVHVYRLISPGTVEERIVQRAEKKLYLDQMVNRESSSHVQQMEELSGSEMLSMLKFGAQCCLALSEAPSDDALDAIIDRSRKEGDKICGVDTGQQRSVAEFDASSEMLNLRELKGRTYGEVPDKAITEVLNLAGVLGPNVGGSTDIYSEWQALQEGKKRARKGRMEKMHVVGVGEVNVLRENNYEMGQEMPNQASGRLRSSHRPEGRQIAGRDYAHEDRCLRCWKGPKGGPAAIVSSSSSYKKLGLNGTLRGCDLCPATFHLDCIGMREEDASCWGTWACPHHSCLTCGRKAAAAGGLLFRCAVCPRAFCEDHLPAEALIMGECERFQALGAAHPKQGCYLLCQTTCVVLSNKLGFGSGEASASAAAVLGATGVDTTLQSSKRKAEVMYKTDDRKAREKLAPDISKALDRLLRKRVQCIGDALPHLVVKTIAAKADDLMVSALENLYDLLFATEQALAVVVKRQRLERVPDLVTKISSWKGVKPNRTIGEIDDASRDEAAELYMQLLRALEGWKTYELNAIVKLLPISSLQGSHGLPTLVRKVPGSTRRVIPAVIALFLTVPNELALVVDNREGSDAMAEFIRQYGHPPFYVNSKVEFKGRKYKVRGGELVPVISRPPPVPPSMMSRPQSSLPTFWQPAKAPTLSFPPVADSV